jgi:hypothetical protein
MRTRTSRILAVDLRESRLGFAAIEMPNKLLEIGIPTFNSATGAKRRLLILLKAFKPSVLVLDRGSRRGKRNKRRLTKILRMMRNHGKLTSIRVEVISAMALRSFFAERGAYNKDDVADLLSGWFPSLSWKIPPRRKCYESERWVMAAFDAVALGVAYLSENENDAAESFRRLPVDVQTA